MVAWSDTAFTVLQGTSFQLPGKVFNVMIKDESYVEARDNERAKVESPDCVVEHFLDEVL